MIQSIPIPLPPTVLVTMWETLLSGMDAMQERLGAHQLWVKGHKYRTFKHTCTCT